MQKAPSSNAIWPLCQRLRHLFIEARASAIEALHPGDALFRIPGVDEVGLSNLTVRGGLGQDKGIEREPILGTQIQEQTLFARLFAENYFFKRKVRSVRARRPPAPQTP